MPNSQYEEGTLWPGVFQWLDQDPQIDWDDLRRTGEEYDAPPVEPELIGRAKAKISCETRFLGEDGFCGYICRRYRFTCGPSGPNRAKSFLRWREMIWAMNPPILIDRRFPGRGVRVDGLGRDRPLAAWDRALIDAVNAALFTEIQKALKERGCPTMCPIQMSAPQVHLGDGRLGDGSVNRNTGKSTVELEICMDCWPMAGDSDETITPNPEVGDGLADDVTVFWRTRNPPCAQKGFKTALTACVHLLSRRTMSKAKMTKKALAILNSTVSAEANRRKKDIFCSPREECDIVWAEHKDYHKGYRSKRAGFPNNSGSTLVRCREYKAKCVWGGAHRKSESSWEGNVVWGIGVSTAGGGQEAEWTSSMSRGGSSSATDRASGANLTDDQAPRSAKQSNLFYATFGDLAEPRSDAPFRARVPGE